MGLFDRLKKRGNFNHNMDVLKEKHGSFVVEKGTGNSQPSTHFLPCEFCYGFYHKQELRKHLKRCVEKPEAFVVGRHVQSSASILLYADNTASTDLI